MASKSQVEQYYEEGYFVVADAVEAQELELLTAALRRALDKVYSGAVVDDFEKIGTGGAGAQAQTLWGLIAPEYGEPVFAEHLGSQAVYTHMRSLLGDELRLGWLCAIAVKGGGYEIGWHRDIGKEERDGTYEVEMEILGRYRKNLVKWHLALVDDACLWLVPGSQKRYRTEEEREVFINNPGGEISNGLQISLKRGQAVFWNGNTIHRGRMPEGVEERLTLTGALVKHEEGVAEKLDGRFRWCLADNVRGSLPDNVQVYYDRWCAAVGA